MYIFSLGFSPLLLNHWGERIVFPVLSWVFVSLVSMAWITGLILILYFAFHCKWWDWHGVIDLIRYQELCVCLSVCWFPDVCPFRHFLCVCLSLWKLYEVTCMKHIWYRLKTTQELSFLQKGGRKRRNVFVLYIYIFASVDHVRWEKLPEFYFS